MWSNTYALYAFGMVITLFFASIFLIITSAYCIYFFFITFNNIFFFIFFKLKIITITAYNVIFIILAYLKVTI